MLSSNSRPLVFSPVVPLRPQARRTRAAFSKGGRDWWHGLMDEGPSDSEEVITFLGADGTITSIPSLPRGAAARPRRPAPAPPLPLPFEQGLCLGSVFAIRAHNGVDATRRLHMLGFCQSVDHLAEVVESCVLLRGGEVIEAERRLRSGVSPVGLSMAVAIPSLWGVPPEAERLKTGIKSGGGIIDRVYKEWLIY